MFADAVAISFADTKHVWCTGCDKCRPYGAVCQKSTAVRWKFLWWQMGWCGHTFLILCCCVSFIAGMAYLFVGYYTVEYNVIDKLI